MDDQGQHEVTVLSTDIKDSTPMVRALGNDRYETELFADHKKQLESLLQVHGGTIVQDHGDGFHIFFSDPLQAINCAVDLQNRLRIQGVTTTDDSGTLHRVQVRMGMHTGRVTNPGERDRLVLTHVSRVINLADEGQILLSQELFAKVQASLGPKCREWKNRYFKGFDALQTVYEYDYDGVRRRETGTRFIPFAYAEAANVYIERAGKEREIREVFFERGRGRDGTIPYRLVTIHGSGGMGKTRLAVYCGKQMAGEFPAGVHFVSLASVSAPSRENVASTICGELHLTFPPTVKASDFLLAYLRQSGDMLLILDNAESVLGAGDEALYLLDEMLSVSPGLRLLATSRERINLEDEFAVDVNAGLEMSESATLFVTRAAEKAGGRPAPDTTVPEFVELMELAGHIPLAIEFLAANYGSYGTLAEMRDNYKASVLSSSLAEARGLPKGDAAAKQRHKSLLASLDWSWKRLGAGNYGADAQHAFVAASLFDEPFTVEALKATLGWDRDDRVRRAINRLLDAALLTTVEGSQPTRYRMHRFLREYGREDWYSKVEGQTHPIDSTDLRRGMVDYYQTLLNEHKPRLGKVGGVPSGELLDWEWRNVLAAADAARNIKSPHDCANLYNGLWLYFQLRGKWADWEAATKAALENLIAMKDRPNTGIAHNNLGMVYTNQGRWKEAEDAYRQALDVFAVLEDNVRAVPILINLGNVFQSEGRWKEAETVCLKAIDICRELKDRNKEGFTLINLGNVYYSQGRSSQAEAVYQQALQIMRDFRDRVNEGLILNNLGDVYYNQGRLKEAEDYCWSALVIFKEFNDRIREALASNNLGMIFSRLGRQIEAEEAFKLALAIYREFGDRIGEAQTIHNLSLFWDMQGEYGKAAEYARQGIVAAEQTEDTALLQRLRDQLKDCEEKLAPYP